MLHTAMVRCMSATHIPCACSFAVNEDSSGDEEIVFIKKLAKVYTIMYVYSHVCLEIVSFPDPHVRPPERGSGIFRRISWHC